MLKYKKIRINPKYLFTFAFIIVGALILQFNMSSKAFACSSLNSGSGEADTLSAFCTGDPNNGSTNGYDKPCLSLSSSSNCLDPSGADFAGGSTVSFNAGYKSQYGSNPSYPHIITWVDISLNGNPGTNLISSITQSGGNTYGAISSDSYCFDEVAGSNSPYNDPHWINAGTQGKFFCDQQDSNSGYPIGDNPVRGPVAGGTCSAAADPGTCSRPSYPGDIPPPPGYGTGGGASVLFYNNGDAPGTGFYNPTYNFNLTFNNVSSNQTFCMRVHVARTNVDPGGAWGNSLGDFTQLADTDLYDVRAADSAPICYNVVPTTTIPSTCTDIRGSNADGSFPDPSANTQWLISVQDSNGNIQIPSNTSNNITTSPTTSSYGGDQLDYDDATDNPDLMGRPFFVMNHASTNRGPFLVDPLGENLRVILALRQHSSSGWTTLTYSDQTYNCYHAYCSQISVNSPVIEGMPINATATIVDDGPADLPNSIKSGNQFTVESGYSSGNSTPDDTGSSLSFAQAVAPPGTPVAIYRSDPTINVPIQGLMASPSNTPYTLTLTAHPEYYPDYFDFGAGTECPPITVQVYAPFNIIGQPNATLNPTTEAPTSATYSASICNYIGSVCSPGNAVADSATWQFTAPSYCPSSGPYSSNGPWNGGTTGLSLPPGSCSFTASQVKAGDQFCTDVYLYYTTGYVGSSPYDVVDTNYTGVPYTFQSCQKVVNEPTFKVYNSSISAGRSVVSQSTGSCSDGGEIAGWNNDTGTNPVSEDYGSGSELNAIANLGITGFATNQHYPPALNGPPTNLSFSNLVNVGAPDTDSPSLGGDFGDTASCYNPPPITCNSNISGDVFNINSYSSGSYCITGDPGVKIISGKLNPNTDISLQVNGPVYISSDNGGITYGGDGTWNIGSVPSFVLVANGPIYIDPGVKELDGIYSSANVNGTTKSTIYTCADPAHQDPTQPFQPLAQNSLYQNCNNQLAIYGQFQANHINLMRTYGSERDETPSTPIGGTPGVQAPVAFGYGAPISGDNCARMWEPAEPGGPHYVGPSLPATSWGVGTNYLCVPVGDGTGMQEQVAFYCNGILGTGNPCDSGNNSGSAANESYCDNIGGLIDNTPYNYPDGDSTDSPHLAGNPDFSWSDVYICSTYQPEVITSATPISSATTHTIFGKQYWCTSLNAADDTYGNGVFQELYFCLPAGVSPTPALAQSAFPCSNGNPSSGGGTPLLQFEHVTCAAEVFTLSPELFLSSPQVTLPNGGVLQYQAVNSLPPFL